MVAMSSSLNPAGFSIVGKNFKGRFNSAGDVKVYINEKFNRRVNTADVFVPWLTSTNVDYWINVYEENLANNTVNYVSGHPIARYNLKGWRVIEDKYTDQGYELIRGWSVLCSPGDFVYVRTGGGLSNGFPCPGTATGAVVKNSPRQLNKPTIVALVPTYFTPRALPENRGECYEFEGLNCWLKGFTLVGSHFGGGSDLEPATAGEPDGESNYIFKNGELDPLSGIPVPSVVVLQQPTPLNSRNVDFMISAYQECIDGLYDQPGAPGCNKTRARFNIKTWQTIEDKYMGQGYYRIDGVSCKSGDSIVVRTEGGYSNAFTCPAS